MLELNVAKRWEMMLLRQHRAHRADSTWLCGSKADAACRQISLSYRRSIVPSLSPVRSRSDGFFRRN